MNKLTIIFLFFISHNLALEIDQELANLVNFEDENLEMEDYSLSSRPSSARPRSTFTPQQMTEAYGNIKNIKHQLSRSPSKSPSKDISSGILTPIQSTFDLVPQFELEENPFKPDKLDNLILKMQGVSTPGFIYPFQHVFEGSGGGGKHFIEDLEELQQIVSLEDENLPFIKNNNTNQTMGMVYIDKDKKKRKFSSIFPLGISPREIHSNLLLLDFEKTHAKGKLFAKTYTKNSIIMRFDDYFIVIDLDNYRLGKKVIANTLYPLFNLKKIEAADFFKDSNLIDLVNYSILQADKKWGSEIVAQINVSSLKSFLQFVLSNVNNFKKYVIGCSENDILIKIPFDFVNNEVNFDFDTQIDLSTNLENMYKINIEIPRIICNEIIPDSADLCSIFESSD